MNYQMCEEGFFLAEIIPEWNGWEKEILSPSLAAILLADFAHIIQPLGFIKSLEIK